VLEKKKLDANGEEVKENGEVVYITNQGIIMAKIIAHLLANHKDAYKLLYTK